MRKDLEIKVNESKQLEIYRIQALKECPLLSDKNFTDKYPGIIEVATFIYLTREETKRNGYGEAIPLFEERGIKDLNEYLALIPCIINKGTRAHYENIKEMLERIQ